MPEEIQVATSCGSLAARVWGPAQGAPVLAVHGWLDSAASFDHVAPLLPALRIVALDLPGHGLSAHAPTGQLYPFIDNVAAVHEVAHALGWDRFSLLGHSLGAAVCSIFAGTFPDRVDQLALLEGLGPMTEDPKHAPERLAKSLVEQAEKRGRAAPVHASRAAAERRLLTTPSKMKPTSVRTLLSRAVRDVDGDGDRDGDAQGRVTWRSDPALRIASRLRLTDAQVLAFLGAITARTLLIRGQTGFAFVPGSGSPQVAAVRELSVVELPGGHHLHLDEPEPVAAALAAFFVGDR